MKRFSSSKMKEEIKIDFLTDERELKQSRNFQNFEACNLCKNGDYPINAKVRPSESSSTKCEDIYLDLTTLDKHTNPYQCSQKMGNYRRVCCEEKHGPSPMTALSTVAGVLLVYSFVRRIISRRRARMRQRKSRQGSSTDPSVATSIDEEISIDYTDMDDDETEVTNPRVYSRHWRMMKQNSQKRPESQEVQNIHKKPK